ncbi:hypothetical protein FRC03_012168 [Tulasnella sp. 419]|nr:hypothetical protein FRC03_012168 [Tulasnella sp. 419]
MVGLESSQSLLFTINHVFMPPQLPQEDDFKHEREQALCQSVLDAAEEFHSHLPINERHSFGPIPKLLQHFSTARRTEDLSRDQIVRSMKDMQSGDVLGFLIRAQNAAVIIRKEATMVIFESFEVSPPDEVVLETKGRIVRSFPEPAIQIPIEVFQDAKFQTELARFLAAMDNDPLDSAAVTIKAGSENPEVRDTPHPRYITQLLTEILRGMGEVAEVPRIVKRIADDVLWQNAFKPWRRSPTWLVLRVALQTTLFRINEGHAMYKAFITFLHARMLKSCLQSDLPSHLIDFMRKKTARRLFKLGSSAPSFLLEYVDEVVNESETLLQGRWSEVQKEQATSLTSTWDPTTLHPAADTELTLSNSREYLIQALQEHDQEKSVKVFDPKLRPRLLGVENFKSPADSLEAAFKSNDHIVALADFEQAVLTDLEDWASDVVVMVIGTNPLPPAWSCTSKPLPKCTMTIRSSSQ